MGLISWGAEIAQPLLVSGYFSAGRLFCHLSLDVPWSQGTNMCFPRVPLWRPAKAPFALLNAGFSTSCARVSSQPMWLERHWRLSQWSAFSATRACPGGFPGSAGCVWLVQCELHVRTPPGIFKNPDAQAPN